MNIVHLVTHDLSPAKADTIRALCTLHAAEFRHRVIQLGSGPLPWTDGPPVSRVHLLPDWMPFQRSRLQEAVGGDRAGGFGGRCILHAWTPNAARRAAPLLRDSVRIVIEVASTRVVPACVVWPRSGRMADVPWYVCPTTMVRQALVQAGVPKDRCTILRPAAGRFHSNSDQRARIRADVGLQPDQIAVLPLPPVTRESGAIWVAWASLLAANARPNVRLIVPSGNGEAERLWRLVRACRHEHVARRAPSRLTIAQLILISDVIAFLPAGDAPVDTLSWAAVSGRPLVVTALPSFGEILGNYPHAVSCRPGCPADAARAILLAIDKHQASAGECSIGSDRESMAGSPQEKTISSYLLLYESVAT